MAVKNISAKNFVVFGIYASSFDAECGAADLISAGFSSRDISVLISDVDRRHEFVHQKASTAPEGTTAGTSAGGLLGGALGILTGVGALVLPGIGTIVAAGPILSGLGAAGGLIGALRGFGIPEYEAKRYEAGVVDGGTLLAVHCDSPRLKRAKQILNSSGANHVAASGESRSEPTDLALI